MTFYGDPSDPEPSMLAPNVARLDDSTLGSETGVIHETKAADVNALVSAIPIAPGSPASSAGVHPANRPVSGRYRSSGIGFQLDLRVDVDGPRTMRRVSGDYF